jgi:RNA polymerase sigma-70 factor (ECF subfamily)
MDDAARDPDGIPAPGTIPASGVGAAERGALLGLCYRMLGSLADAEDAVQETYARWLRLGDAERGGIRHPKAWLMKAASRVCLDMLGSARARREQYWGEWLPEPVPNTGLWSSQSLDGSADPSERVTLDESVSMAVLVVLESMTPAERVAFVLHDVFEYSFAEIGEIVGRSPEASRQLASSARRRIRAERRSPVDAAAHAAVVRSFKHAWQTGDVEALVALLDPNAVAIGDGGGIVTALKRPLVGADWIVKAFTQLGKDQPAMELRETVVNGELGLTVLAGDELLAVVSLAVSDGRIQRIWAMRNPEKLSAW